MQLSYDEKLNLMKVLNWDYLDTYEDMLAVIDGTLDSSGSFDREKLFVRSLERLPWHFLTALWGVEAIKLLYTPETAQRIWPKERRYNFDFVFALLRGESLPPSRWGVEYYKSERHRFFSDRGDGTKPGLL